MDVVVAISGKGVAIEIASWVAYLDFNNEIVGQNYWFTSFCKLGRHAGLTHHLHIVMRAIRIITEREGLYFGNSYVLIIRAGENFILRYSV